MTSSDVTPAPQTPTWRPENRSWHFAVLWLVLFFGLVAGNFRFYFAEEHWEVGDAAANALQIRQAKYLNELHGNYSRFQFHHPGPGFFYAYAAGEWLLYDLLKVVPSPHNTHALVGVLLQTGFLAWTLAILARHVSHSLLVPLVLIFAALHFGAVNYNIPHSLYDSIWPPHVLLFPFLCFVVACASLASGSARAILPSVTAGCLLVHGHVAQPLFVLPLFLSSCVAFVLGARSSTGSVIPSLRNFRWSFLAAAVVLLIFVLPIALDAFRGDQSNLHRIIGHLLEGGANRKTLLQSLNYLGALLCYIPNPEKYCDVLGSGSLIYARHRWYVILGWLCLAAFLFVSYRRNTGHAAFARWLHIHLVAGILLLLCWAIMQADEMFAFNSHFAFGLFFVPLILSAIAICEKTSERIAGAVAPGAFLVAVPLIATSAYDGGAAPLVSTGPAFQELAAAAKSEPHRKKFLRFQTHDWPWAIGSALALRRLGMDYRVEPKWGFMFGVNKTASLARSIRTNRMAIWQLGADPAKRKGFQLTSELFVATSPAALAPNAEIRFAGEGQNAAEWASDGWELSTGPFSSSVKKTAVLYFQPLPAAGDVEMTLDAVPQTLPALPAQRMIVSMHGHQLADVTLSSAAELYMVIPAGLWNARETATVLFEFPTARSPAELGVGSDWRRLGFGFRRISFRELPTQ